MLGRRGRTEIQSNGGEHGVFKGEVINFKVKDELQSPI